MTKKAACIYQKYCQKLNVELFLYQEQIIDFHKLQENTMEVYHEFQDMITSMYHYNLLSGDDFDELFTKSYPAQSKIINAVLGIETTETEAENVSNY